MRKSLLSLLLLFLCVGIAWAQKKQVSVTGLILASENNEPIDGASVLCVEFPRSGVLTDAKGRFTLTLPEGAKHLRISYIGYATQTVALTGRELRVVLQSTEKTLDPLVVSAYGTQRRSSLTGATSSVKASAIASAKVESVDKALAGKVAGVRVTSQTGEPGAAGTLQIRGVGSINGTTEPLYVVDGVPITAGDYGVSGLSSNILASINPEDIESISVLKDAASASLYGSRAANGVVIITTKRGKQGKTNFSFKASTGFSQLATNSFDVMNASEAFDYQREAFINQILYKQDAILPTGANYANRAALRKQAEATVTDSYIASNDYSFVRSRETRTDWRKELLGTGRLSDVSFSANGGTEGLRYFASLGYNDIKSIAPYGSFSRYSGLLNLDNKATKWLDLSFKGQVSYTAQQGIGDNSRQSASVSLTHPTILALVSRPDQPVRLADGSYNPAAAPMKRGDNPIELLDPDRVLNQLGTLRGLAGANAQITFTDYLSFKTTNSIEYTLVKSLQYTSPLTSDGARVGGQGIRLNNELTVKTTSNVLNFNKDFDRHHVDALAGIEAQSFEQLRHGFAVNKYSTSKLKELGNGQVVDSESNHYGSFLLSYLGRLNYNYNNLYYAGLSLRNDISSKLGKNNRSGVFYSVSGAWRFGREAFLKDNKFITDAKLRASYGTNGNLPDAEYSWRGLYSFGGSYGPESAIYLSQLANLDLGWEKSRSLNVGLDLTLAKRFTLGIEYFDKYTTNLLMQVPVSYNHAVTTYQDNSGEISNRGVEIELHASDLLRSNKLRWDLDFSLTKIRSRVEALPNGDIISGPNSIYLYRQGSDVYTFYLPHYVGVDQASGLGKFLIDPSKPEGPDNITYNHAEAGRGPSKSAYPKVYGGLTNSLSYGGFTLSALISYQFGGYIYDHFDAFAIADGQRSASINASKELVGNYWTPTNTGASNPLPILLNPLRSGSTSTRQLHSSDFIRLKEVSLSYRLPESLTKTLRIGSASLSLTANNLAFLYAATKNRELEAALNGFRSADIPALRTISFGLNVGF